MHYTVGVTIPNRIQCASNLVVSASVNEPLGQFPYVPLPAYTSMVGEAGLTVQNTSSFHIGVCVCVCVHVLCLCEREIEGARILF